ncbi:hypothetical protein M5D96_012366 [Drosophila gunungcola]|uniref:Uncharacterized protein n=1 Tax=Drosophila gunungcola TaxID=103775 RepID=A0A9Q0BKE0_9MUSC|nr:hypothetical protein M5D96_012366 [Drosophila gunungcola]
MRFPLRSSAVRRSSSVFWCLLAFNEAFSRASLSCRLHSNWLRRRAGDRGAIKPEKRTKSQLKSVKLRSAIVIVLVKIRGPGGGQS